MSRAPSTVSPELELYRAVMHNRLTALRQTTPDLSIPSAARQSLPAQASRGPVAGVGDEAFDPGRAGKILLVEDEPPLARAYQRTLKLHGLSPCWVGDATSALGELRSRSYDVVVSDIMLPDHSGLELLRHVRNCDPDLPIVLVTGTPDLDGAIDAVALGAFRYLVKPISNDRLLQCVAQAQRMRQMARLREEAMARQGALDGVDETDLARAFERALEPLWMAYQPIIRWPCRSLYGYQALARSDEPSLALPSALVRAAERLDRRRDLSRAVHRSVAKTARGLPGDARVFVSVSVADLSAPDLYDGSSPLGEVASSITLDLVDVAALAGVDDLRARVSRLRSLGYWISAQVPVERAGDLGAPGVISPEVVKVRLAPDAELGVRREDELALGTAAERCRAAGKDLVVEGVERDEQRDRLVGAGCRLFQDCFFTQPGRRLDSQR